MKEKTMLVHHSAYRRSSSESLERGRPLLTVETEANGDSRSTSKKGPCLISPLGSSSRYNRFLSCLGWSIFSLTISLHLSQSQQAGHAVLPLRLSFNKCLWISHLQNLVTCNICEMVWLGLSEKSNFFFQGTVLYVKYGYSQIYSARLGTIFHQNFHVRDSFKIFYCWLLWYLLAICL